MQVPATLSDFKPEDMAKAIMMMQKYASNKSEIKKLLKSDLSNNILVDMTDVWNTIFLILEFLDPSREECNF